MQTVGAFHKSPLRCAVFACSVGGSTKQLGRHTVRHARRESRSANVSNNQPVRFWKHCAVILNKTGSKLEFHQQQANCPNHLGQSLRASGHSRKRRAESQERKVHKFCHCPLQPASHAEFRKCPPKDSTGFLWGGGVRSQACFLRRATGAGVVILLHSRATTLQRCCRQNDGGARRGLV